MPAIRHLATFNADIPRKHAFYLQVMDMVDATRTDAEIENHLIMSLGKVPEGYVRPPAQFNADGFVNFAILAERGTPTAAGHKTGFDHFGVLVRDPLDYVTRIRGSEPVDEPMDVRPPDRQVEYGITDCEGNRFDLSGSKGWKIDVDRWAKAE